MELGSIFLGNTPSIQRSFVKDLLTFLEYRIEKIYVPCCGQFALVKIAIDCGYPKENIYASDISIFSNLLGYAYTGRNYREYEIKKPYRSIYNRSKSETKRIAIVMYAMKIAQLEKQRNFYIREHIMELKIRQSEYIAQIQQKIEESITFFQGINYDHQDLREVISKDYDDKTLVMVNPPAFKKGYTKMFDFESAIIYDPGIDEFDFKSEYEKLYNEVRQKPCMHIWYRYKEAKAFKASDVICAREYKTDRSDYWLFTKPDVLKKWPLYHELNRKLDPKTPIKRYPIMGTTDTINNNTKVGILPLNESTAMYYRDLWAHKLGTTSGTMFFGFFLDDKIAAVSGFNATKLTEMKAELLFETFCFNTPIQQYPNINRLFMMLICSKEMKDYYFASITKKNRFFEITGIKTVCLSKYRKVKINNGILSIKSRKKLKNGLYHIMYETKFHNRSLNQCVKDYLQEIDGKSS